MSILKKTSLAVALVAAVGLTATAFSYTITGIPVNLANVSVITATGNVAFPAETISYNIQPADNIIGRTTGVSVRLTLQNGATFLTAPTVAPGAAAPGWTATVTAGGGTGDNYIVVSLSPPATPTNLTTGDLVDITLTDITASTLLTVGNSVNGKFDIFDPVGGGTFNTQTLPILNSANVLASSFLNGDVNSRIDVGTDTAFPNSKTAFSTTGAIGAANQLTFDAGTLTQAVATGVIYQFQAADAFTTVVNLSNMGIFDGVAGDGSIMLATNNTCSTPIPGATVTYNPSANTATFTYTAGNLNGFSATGGSAELCFTAPGNVVVNNTTVSTSNSFVAQISGTTSNTSVATALPLQYNGSVVKVPFFNPGGNTVQQSVLRVTNTSSLAGKVTITGTDDNGNPGMPVTFRLPAGASTQINGDALQNGSAVLTGALGTGTGKWRLVVTGEFNGLVVQSLMRNNSDGTFTNMSTGLTPQGLEH